MATLWQDLKYAARSLRLNPAYTAVVIATLTLGIGANAAIFSVADAVMLRPYPYPDMDRLVILNERTRDGQQMSVAWPTFEDWQALLAVIGFYGVVSYSSVVPARRATRVDPLVALRTE